MDAEQISLFDLLFPSEPTSLCSRMKEAHRNECGVFTINRMDFQGGSFKEGSRVVVSMALRSPFVYFAFDCYARMEGRGSPCTEDSERRFKTTDRKEEVLSSIREKLCEYCERLSPEKKHVEKVLEDIRNFL